MAHAYYYAIATVLLLLMRHEEAAARLPAYNPAFFYTHYYYYMRILMLHIRQEDMIMKYTLYLYACATCPHIRQRCYIYIATHIFSSLIYIIQNIQRSACMSLEYCLIDTDIIIHTTHWRRRFCFLLFTYATQIPFSYAMLTIIFIFINSHKDIIIYNE